jgi:hypothetical protein
MLLRTANLDHAIEAVTAVYCPHKIEVGGAVREVNAFLEVAHPTNQQLLSIT